MKLCLVTQPGRGGFAALAALALECGDPATAGPLSKARTCQRIPKSRPELGTEQSHNRVEWHAAAFCLVERKSLMGCAM